MAGFRGKRRGSHGGIRVVHYSRSAAIAAIRSSRLRPQNAVNESYSKGRNGIRGGQSGPDGLALARQQQTTESLAAGQRRRIRSAAHEHWSQSVQGRRVAKLCELYARTFLQSAKD
jgi:hypothetical protein